jgi:hypothetical protein
MNPIDTEFNIKINYIYIYILWKSYCKNNIKIIINSFNFQDI